MTIDISNKDHHIALAALLAGVLGILVLGGYGMLRTHQYRLQTERNLVINRVSWACKTHHVDQPTCLSLLIAVFPSEVSQ